MKWKTGLFRDLGFAGLAALLSLPLGVLLDSLRSQSLGLAYCPPEARLVPEGSRDAGTGLPLISREDVRAALDAPGTWVVDAREQDFYGLGHIPGAVNLPRHTFPAALPALEERLAKASRIIVYCSDEDCQDSHIVGLALLRIGYKEVSVFRGGWAAWEAAGLPVEK